MSAPTGGAPQAAGGAAHGTAGRGSHRAAGGGLRAATGPLALATEEPSGRSLGWWGMVMLIATEATLFAALLGSYFYLRFYAGPQFPPPKPGPPELMRPLIMTAILVPSSIPLAWAERGIRKGQHWRLRLGVVITMVMGLGFAALQGIEYFSKLQKFTVRTNVYGSLFYIITGFHGLHVTIGLLMLGWLLAAAIRGSFGAHRHERVRVVALYWHFVDTVWVFILFTIYLSPRL